MHRGKQRGKEESQQAKESILLLHCCFSCSAKRSADHVTLAGKGDFRGRKAPPSRFDRIDGLLDRHRTRHFQNFPRVTFARSKWEPLALAGKKMHCATFSEGKTGAQTSRRIVN